MAAAAHACYPSVRAGEHLVPRTRPGPPDHGRTVPSSLPSVLGRRAENVKILRNVAISTERVCGTRTILTDARDVYDKVSTEKCGLPQQNALTQEITTTREWLVTSGSQIRCTADENMTMNGVTKDHRESRQHLDRILQEGEWSI